MTCRDLPVSAASCGPAVTARAYVRTSTALPDTGGHSRKGVARHGESEQWSWRSPHRVDARERRQPGQDRVDLVREPRPLPRLGIARFLRRKKPRWSSDRRTQWSFRGSSSARSISTRAGASAGRLISSPSCCAGVLCRARPARSDVRLAEPGATDEPGPPVIARMSCSLSGVRSK